MAKPIVFMGAFYKVGNSLVLTIPSRLVDKNGLKPGQEAKAAIEV